MFQESRDGRDGHRRLEEHDLVAPAPHCRGVSSSRDAATADTSHWAAEKESETGLGLTQLPTKYQRHARNPAIPLLRGLGFRINLIRLCCELFSDCECPMRCDSRIARCGCIPNEGCTLHTFHQSAVCSVLVSDQYVVTDEWRAYCGITQGNIFNTG